MFFFTPLVLTISLLAFFPVPFGYLTGSGHDSISKPVNKYVSNNQKESKKITQTPSPEITYSVSPKSSPTESPKPSSTISLTATPTPLILTSTPVSQPSTSASPTKPPNQQSEDITGYIMNAINDYRRSLGLGPFQTDPYTCSFAKIRAQEISTNFSHEGFTQRLNNHNFPFPEYSYITENIAVTPNYKDVVNLWINSPAHAANMQKDTPFVCVQNYGNYYAYEGWKPLN